MTTVALTRLEQAVPDTIISTHVHRGDAVAIVKADRNLEVLRFLRDDPATRFNMGMDITAIDRLGFPTAPGGNPDEPGPRFEVVYSLYSIPLRHRVRVKCPLMSDDAPELRSAMDIYRSFDWGEREIFDMYGIKFPGHPCLKRLFMYDEFQGHPLRKDFPKERRFPLARREGVE